MTAATASPAAPPGPARVGWLRSPGFDFAFFLAPIALGLAYYAFIVTFPGWWYATSAAFFIVLAYGHYSLTFTFFLDREHRPHYRAQLWRFYLVPAVVIGVVVGGYAALPWLFFAFDYVLTQHHCTKQSTGICSLYRHRAAAWSARRQWWENGAVYFTCTVLVAHGFVRFELLRDVGLGAGWAETAVYRAVSLGAFAVAGSWCAGVLVSMLRVATAEGWGRHAPRIWFWVTSAAMYTPVLYVPIGAGPDAHMGALRTVIIISLTQHWLQYYGIVYLHGRNKYTTPEHRDQRAAAWTAHLPKLFVYAVAFGALLGLFRFASVKLELSTIAGRMAFGAVLSVGWVHYWLDRQIWAFRDAHNRETILPYLK